MKDIPVMSVTFEEEPIYTELAVLGKALANPVRLRLLDLLEEGECSVEALAKKAGFGVKNTSAQLKQLKDANLVAGRRDGNSTYYRIADDRVSGFIGVFQNFAEARSSRLREAIIEYLGEPRELRPITASQLSSLLDDDSTIVVDVRSENDFASSHIPGALSVPMEHLRDHLNQIPKSAEVVAYCQGPYCVVSPSAVRELHQLGYRARALEGGYTRWQRAHRSAFLTSVPDTHSLQNK